MKASITVAALLGLVSVEAVQLRFRPDPAKSPWADPQEPAKPRDFRLEDHASAYYTRVVPDNFTQEGDDRLMNSLIGRYSIEENDAGVPNGNFYLDLPAAYAVSHEVVQTHFGFLGAKRDQYVQDRLPAIWANIDVNKDGRIPASKGPVLLRMLVGDSEVANGLQLQIGETNMSETEENKKFRPNPIQSPWAAPPEEPKFPMFSLYDHTSSYYDRVVPDQFTKEKDDRLMNSLISKYSLEGNEKGQPTGQFYLDQAGARAVANEVVGTHFGFHGQKRDAYVNQRFPEIWKSIDVNNDGVIDVQKGAVMLRMLVGDSEVANGLQLQTEEDIRQTHGYRPNPEQPWSAEAKKGPTPTKITGAYTPADVGAAHVPGYSNLPADQTYNKYYNRNVPDHFSKERDDGLMRSLIENYSVEGQTNGNPNGHFYLTKDSVDDVSREVVKTHLPGVDADSYVKKNGSELWNHTDVNKTGFLESTEVPQYLRSLVGNVESTIGMQ